MAKKRTRRPQPLAPPPQSSALRSRKRARQVTTLFHKYTRERDAAVARARAGGCRVDDDAADDADDADDENADGGGGGKDVVVGEAAAGNDELDSDENSSSSSSSPSSRRKRLALLAEVNEWDAKISEMGGRSEYQKASQLNTDLFSTSKWVLGILGRWGWLDGLRISDDVVADSGAPPRAGQVVETSDDNKMDSSSDGGGERRKGRKKKEKTPRRDVRLLEVGAINTQLLDAAARTRTRKREDGPTGGDEGNAPSRTGSRGETTERVHRLDVEAIDVRSTDPRIRQADFFDLPLPIDPDDRSSSIRGGDAARRRYDVVVCSMVINCVTTPALRGRMLSLIRRHLRPGGVCFLTLPRLCLTQSKFTSRSHFEEVLTGGVGFEILREVGRESPKVAFFVLRRPEEEVGSGDGGWDDKFTRMPIIRRGKKFRNTFAVTLSKDEVGAG